MDIYEQILHYYRVDEMSLRAIARKLEIDRKTVSKVVHAYEDAIATDPEGGLNRVLREEPRYKPRDYTPRVLLKPVTDEIDKWLKENDKRRSSGMRKQCLKRQDIHRQLIEKGFDVSYSSVCKYIARRKAERGGKSKDVFIKIHREPGQECEFDWGEVKLRIRGVVTVFTMAVFAFPYSKGRRAYLFRHQDALAFMESHRNFFRDVNGVPYHMVYDNMKVAVAFTDEGKKPTMTLRRMCTFYRYDFRFCNARAGWEKGNVERSVDYVRGRAFTTAVDFDSIEDAQQWLDKVCDQINTEEGSKYTQDKADKYAEELAALQPYPGAFGCFEVDVYTVDKQSTVTVKGVHYSVPDNLVSQAIPVKLYSEKIVACDSSGKAVAKHERSYRAGDYVVDINHYLNTLMKKTGALEHSEAFHQLPRAMQDLFRVHFMSNGKDFLRLLQYARDNGLGYEEILSAAAEARKRGLKRLTSDHIRTALSTMNAEDASLKEEQKNDDFLEIELGSEDVLRQLECAMEKGAIK